MILTNSKVSVPFDFKKSKVYCLVVENTKFYVSMCKQLLNYNEDTSEFFVYDELKQVKFDDCVDVVYDFLNLNLESKKISNYIIKYLTAHVNEKDYRIELARINTDLNDFNRKLLNNIDIFLTHNSEVGWQDIFKIQDYRVKTTDDMLLNIINYVDVVTKLTNKKTFVFIGAEIVLEKEEIEQLVKQLAYKQINLLFLNPFAKYAFDNIPTIIIDKDLCELHKNIDTND